VNKKLIVRELLIWYCFLLFGFLFLPAVISLLGGVSISQFYRSLATNERAAWVISCSPYVIYLFVRSIVWAVKTLKPKRD
jgi:predicted membrane-bound spermidine synthase